MKIKAYLVPLKTPYQAAFVGNQAVVVAFLSASEQALRPRPVVPAAQARAPGLFLYPADFHFTFTLIAFTLTAAFVTSLTTFTAANAFTPVLHA